MLDIQDKSTNPSSLLVINCKNYEEVAGERITEFVKAAERTSEKYGIKIAIAPPQHMLSSITDSRLTILAQHVDDKKTGSTTGYVIPELLKKSGIDGSIINHGEHKISDTEIVRLVKRLRDLGLISVLCARNTDEVEKFAALNPDYVAIEPPELIGSGRAVSKERPDLITESAASVDNANNDSKLLCGAGIISGTDVRKAMELGSHGVLVASGIVRASDWETQMAEFAEAML